MLQFKDLKLKYSRKLNKIFKMKVKSLKKSLNLKLIMNKWHLSNREKKKNSLSKFKFNRQLKFK